MPPGSALEGLKKLRSMMRRRIKTQSPCSNGKGNDEMEEGSEDFYSSMV